MNGFLSGAKMMKNKHKQMYMNMAKVLASASKDERLKVGTVIIGKNGNIIATGYNGYTAHIDAPNQLPDGTTSELVRHSEKNALMALTKCNESSVGATMITTHSCCLSCAVDIVDAGIVKFIYNEEYRCNKGIEHLEKYGVKVEKIGGSYGLG